MSIVNSYILNQLVMFQKGKLRVGLEVAFLYGPGTLKKKHVSIKNQRTKNGLNIWLGESSY